MNHLDWRMLETEMSELSFISQVGSLTYNFRREEKKKSQVSIEWKLSQMKHVILIPLLFSKRHYSKNRN